MTASPRRPKRRLGHPRIEEGVRGVLGVANAVGVLVNYGSGGRAQVEQRLAEWEGRVE